MTLGLGAVAGLITAYPVAQLGIPSFVASLAGWLIYRGLLLLVTAATGTIIIQNDAFNAIGNGYIPDIFPERAFLPDIHIVTLLLGLVAIVLFIINAFKSRQEKQAYDFEVLPKDMFIFELIFVSIIVGLITWVLAGYNGLSWTVVVVLIVVGIYHFITTQTVIGRHIYAIGGNPEAAELSGISVKKLTFAVFSSMGMLSGAVRHPLRLAIAIRHHAGRHALRVGRHRGGLHRRRLGRGRRRQSDRLAHRRDCLHVPHQRDELDERGHRLSVRRPGRGVSRRRDLRRRHTQGRQII